MLSAVALVFGTTPVLAQVQGEPTIASGKCDPKSGVTVGDSDISQFTCDMTIIARTERGTVLIQFADKTGVDGRILGFAGTIEGRQGFAADRVQTIAVERLYLAGGARPIPVTAGTCFLNWAAQKLTSAICGARANVNGQLVKAMATLTVR